MRDGCSYPYRYGLAHQIVCDGYDIALPTHLELLPHVMKRGGYQTHMVGKWDVRHLRTTTPLITPGRRHHVAGDADVPRL